MRKNKTISFQLELMKYSLMSPKENNKKTLECLVKTVLLLDFYFLFHDILNWHI